MPLFSPKIHSFGIDLSDLSIKIAQAKKSKGRFILTSISESSLPEGLIQKGIIEKEGEKDLIEIIKKTISNTRGKKIRTKYAICSLPEENTFIKVIQVPKVEETEMREVIKWQIESNFPVRLDDVYFDWEVVRGEEDFQKVKESKDDIKGEASKKLLNVSVAVVPKKIVNSYLKIFKKANVQPIVFEIESMAVARSLILGSFSPHPVILLDIGKCGTGLTIFSGRTILFTSHIDISGQNFDEVISRNLKVNLNEAERLKKGIGLVSLKEVYKGPEGEFLSHPEWKVYHVPVIERNKSQKKRPKKELKVEIDLLKAAKEDQVFSALVPIITDLSEQIQHYINYFRDLGEIEYIPDGVVSKVLLCGGDSKLIGLTDFISSSLELPVKIGNPLVNISSSGNIFTDNAQKQALPYATTIGLAIRGAE